MLLRQILLGLHLLQATLGPLELKCQPLTLIKTQDRSFCGYNQLDTPVIKLIDETDKPPGLILLLLSEGWDVANQHSLEQPGQFNIIILTSWTVT